MSNFIGMVFGVLKEHGIDTSDMSVEEAIEKFNELEDSDEQEELKQEENKTNKQSKILQNKEQVKISNGNIITGNNKTDKKIEEIRRAKKEKLIVCDENGDILHEEDGNAIDVGTEEFNYKGKITYHNHPTGKAYPYPSEQDFKTAEKSDMAKMVVVSQDYTYIYEKDENFESLSGVRPGLSKVISANENQISQEMWNIKEAAKRKYVNREYKSFDEYKQDLIKQNIDYINKKYTELAKQSGYNLKIEKFTR